MSADPGARTGGARTGETALAQGPGVPHAAADVSALFDSTSAVDRALVALSAAGLPRDLVEVVVAPAAARRFYGGTARGPGRQALRYAGIGGLTGLVLGAAGALVMLALGAVEKPGVGALVQLLGPNMTTVTGALIGGAIGAFVRRSPAPRHARAAESPDDVVVVVRARSSGEATAVAEVLTAAGGRAPRVALARAAPSGVAARLG